MLKIANFLCNFFQDVLIHIALIFYIVDVTKIDIKINTFFCQCKINSFKIIEQVSLFTKRFSYIPDISFTQVGKKGFLLSITKHLLSAKFIGVY